MDSRVNRLEWGTGIVGGHGGGIEEAGMHAALSVEPPLLEQPHKVTSCASAEGAEGHAALPAEQPQAKPPDAATAVASLGDAGKHAALCAEPPLPAQPEAATSVASAEDAGGHEALPPPSEQPLAEHLEAAASSEEAGRPTASPLPTEPPRVEQPAAVAGIEGAAGLASPTRAAANPMYNTSSPEAPPPGETDDSPTMNDVVHPPPPPTLLPGVAKRRQRRGPLQIGSCFADGANHTTNFQEDLDRSLAEDLHRLRATPTPLKNEPAIKVETKNEPVIEVEPKSEDASENAFDPDQDWGVAASGSNKRERGKRYGGRIDRGRVSKRQKAKDERVTVKTAEAAIKQKQLSGRLQGSRLSDSSTFAP